jgi:hypothetical protein
MAWHTILDFDKSGGAGNHSRNITLQFWMSSDNIESNMYLRYPNHKMRCPWVFSDTILEPGHRLLTQIAHGISRNITWYETTPPFIYFSILMVLKREATQGYRYLLALHSQVVRSYAYFWAHPLVRYAGNQQPFNSQDDPWTSQPQVCRNVGNQDGQSRAMEMPEAPLKLFQHNTSINPAA